MPYIKLLTDAAIYLEIFWFYA